MEFKALRVSSLNQEVAANLEALFSSLTGVKQYTITIETQELSVRFDEKTLSFQTLIQEMTGAGCALKDIDAALLR